MKQRKTNLLIVVLILLLAWSIVLNFYQSGQVDRLMEEMKDMEYTQSVLSACIEELEGVKTENEAANGSLNRK